MIGDITLAVSIAGVRCPTCSILDNIQWMESDRFWQNDEIEIEMDGLLLSIFALSR